MAVIQVIADSARTGRIGDGPLVHLTLRSRNLAPGE